METNAVSMFEQADRLRAIATMGISYSTNEYDTDRYEKVLDIALHLASLVGDRSFEELKKEYLEDNWVHVSPMNGAEAALFVDRKILLMRRADNGLWCIPGGLVEVGESLSEAAERELLEETGVAGKVTKLLGIFDSRKWGSRVKSQMYHSIFLVESDRPSPAVSNEALEVAFFGRDELPPLSPGHAARVSVVFDLVEGRREVPYVD